MDKHEYRIKTEQMLDLMSRKSYKQAMDIADEIDWRKVKNTAMLCAVSEIYEYNGEYQKSRDILFLAYDRSPESRKIIYRLGTLALKLGEMKEAMDCYDEFIALAPKDPNQYIFKYKILKCQNAPLSEQIAILEAFKKVDYVEKWAFELAKLYREAGMTAECIDECDDLILWFSEGKYVYKAMELKMQYKPLTPMQQEKYNYYLSGGKPAEEKKAEVEVMTEKDVAEPETETVAEQAEIAPEEEAKTAPETEATSEQAEAEAAPEEEAKAAPETEATSEQAEAEAAPEEEAKAAPETEAASEQAEAVIAPEQEQEQKEAPTLSIEEMLQEWEEKQKENAQMIRAEFEKAENEKAESEKAQENTEDSEKTETEESILPDDVRQLMEELETESADIEAQKIRLEEEVPEEKPLIQKMSLEEAVSEMVPEAIREAKEEVPEIRVGDTQSMAAVAKALKNNVEVELPEEVPEEAEERTPGVYDTGFIVKGRYDLEAQSAIGLKAGLTEEQKKLFSYFVPVHGMSEQIVEVLENDKQCKSRYGTSRIGNLVIIGRKGSGKTVLAVDIVKAIQKARRRKPGKVAIVTAESLNKKDVKEILGKLQGGAIIIEKASRLNRRTIDAMCEAMEGQTGELLVVLEDERKPIERMLEAYPQFSKKFTSRLELPVFINDELVTFAQTYAKENGYKIDEMGILALYTRIDMLQRDERVVTVADVKEIVDEAIENSQRGGLKKFFQRITGRHTDESDRIVLREEDFK